MKFTIVHFVTLFVLLNISIMNPLTAQDRIVGKTFANRSEVLAQKGMASTSQPLATQIALDVLKQGGNAIDAAIAANAAIGLMEPTGSGIGGDLFAIVWDAESGKLYGLNASGRSPKSLSLEYFIEKGYEQVPYQGALSVSVPGCVDGWFELHRKFGSLDMGTILEPAIRYAKEGFPVTPYIAYGMERNARSLAKYPGFKETYMPNGHTPDRGEIFKNPRLAKTLEQISNNGRDAYYKGEIAKTIAKTVQEQGGFLSYEDLESHHSEWIEPVSTNYRGYDVWELPPNGQGIAVLQMLNILEGYDIEAMGFGSADYIHTFVEAKKLAYEDRAKFYADMDFYNVPLEELISKEYAEERRNLINPEKAARNYPAGEIEKGNTIYMTVADQYGNMVSLIQSNYGGMGSGIIPEELGFMLQNRGALFAIDSTHANQFEPGKRPFHTIIPAFITTEGKPFISFGLMGGAMQPQGHVQIVVNLVDFGMNLQEAGDAPRIRHMGSSQPTGEVMSDGGEINLESGFEYEVIRTLMGRGHKISYQKGIYGSYHAIMWDDKNKTYHGACESRYDGQAAGY
ncbi:MAG: gamma-glutamyltransferase [Bacteroidales bacterium]